MATRRNMQPERRRQPIGFLGGSTTGGRQRRMAAAMPDINLGREFLKEHSDHPPSEMRKIKSGVSEALSGTGVKIDFLPRKRP